MWSDLNNNIIAYAIDSTLYVTIKCSADRSEIEDSLNLELSKIESLGDLRIMCLSLRLVILRLL